MTFHDAPMFLLFFSISDDNYIRPCDCLLTLRQFSPLACLDLPHPKIPISVVDASSTKNEDGASDQANAGISSRGWSTTISLDNLVSQLILS